MELGQRSFRLGCEAAVMDEFSRQQALVKIDEAIMWAERGLILAGAEPAGDQT